MVFLYLYMQEHSKASTSGHKTKISLIPKDFSRLEYGQLCPFLLSREALAQPKTRQEFAKIMFFCKKTHRNYKISVLQRNYVVTDFVENKFLPEKIEEIQNLDGFSVCLTPSVSCQIQKFTVETQTFYENSKIPRTAFGFRNQTFFQQFVEEACRAGRPYEQNYVQEFKSF